VNKVMKSTLLDDQLNVRPPSALPGPGSPSLNATHPEIQIQLRPETTGEQYRVVAWAITVINAFSRLGVTSREPLPDGH
jgi:hypothetical protein